MPAKTLKQAPLLSAFISHAKADAKKASAIAEALESRGFKCWIAPRDVKAGRSYGDEIIRGIESAQNFVLVLSKASNDSAFVAREVERAVSKKKPIFAVRIANVEPAPSLELFISGTQWIDAFPGRLATHIDRLAGLLGEEGDAEAAVSPVDKDNDRPKPPRWIWPAAAAVLVAITGSVALWLGHVPSTDGSSSVALQTQAAPSRTNEGIKGGASGSPIDLSSGDLDFRACEKLMGDEAIAACDRAIASGKFVGRSLSYLYSDRGFLRMQKGDLETALADLDEAARIDPTNFYAFWNRGAVYAAQGDFGRAEENFTKALALNPDETSKAKIEEALNAVGAGAKAANAQTSDPSVITDPTVFGGGQEGSASASSNEPADATPAWDAEERDWQAPAEAQPPEGISTDH